MLWTKSDFVWNLFKLRVSLLCLPTLCYKIDELITHSGLWVSYFQFFSNIKMCLWARQDCGLFSISVSWMIVAFLVSLFHGFLSAFMFVQPQKNCIFHFFIWSTMSTIWKWSCYIHHILILSFRVILKSKFFGAKKVYLGQFKGGGI